MNKNPESIREICFMITNFILNQTNFQNGHIFNLLMLMTKSKFIQ